MTHWKVRKKDEERKDLKDLEVESRWDVHIAETASLWRFFFLNIIIFNWFKNIYTPTTEYMTAILILTNVNAGGITDYNHGLVSTNTTCKLLCKALHHRPSCACPITLWQRALTWLMMLSGISQTWYLYKKNGRFLYKFRYKKWDDFPTVTLTNKTSRRFSSHFLCNLLFNDFLIHLQIRLTAHDQY